MASVAKREWTHGGVKKTAWVVRYTDQDGKRRMKTFVQKKSADKYRLQVTMGIEKGEHTAGSQVLDVKALCSAYLRHSEDRVRDGRIGQSRYQILTISINKSIVRHIGHYKSPDLTPMIIEDFYRKMTRNDGLAPVTARERVYIFAEIEAFAFKRKLVHKRVAAEALKELHGIKAKPIRTFMKDDMLRVLTAAPQRKVRGSARSAAWLDCMVNVAAFCGLRYGEIVGLTVPSIDFDRRVLHIRHNLTRFDVLKSPKTRSGIRDVPMPSHVAALLLEWLRVHYLDNERELVFRTQEGSMLKPNNFHKAMWGPCLKRAGLGSESGDNYHFHALRHFAASWMIENGLPVTEVAVILGHSKFDMTLQTYAHPVIAVARRHEAIERMAAKLLPLSRLDATRARHELPTS